MPSKTSSYKAGLFSRAMFIQSCKLYAPLPVIYFVGLFVYIPLRFFLFDMEEQTSSSHAQPFLGALAQLPSSGNYGGAFISIMISLICAMLAFRYLYLARSTNMIHSLPIRREGLFCTQYIVGLAMMIVPNLGILLLTLMASALHGFFYPLPVLLWFLSQSALCFFFYSFAVFCGMLTGSLGGQPIYFILLNFLAMFVSMVLEPLFTLFYVGYSSSTLITGWPRSLTPVYSLTLGALIEATPLIDQSTGLYVDYSYQMNNPPLFWAYMAVGLVLTVLSLLIYRHRHLEGVGEAVSLKFMRPIFRICIAVIGGMALGIGTILFLDFTNEDLTRTLFVPCSLLWGLIFFFVAEMMLQRKTKVWHHWRKCAVSLLMILMIYGLLILDLTGFEEKIPARDEIRQISLAGLDGLLYDSAADLSYLVQNEEEGVSQELYDLVVGLHQSSLAANREEHFVMYPTNPSIHITYRLHSGDSLTRHYYVPLSHSQAQTQGTPSYYQDQILNLPQRQEDAYQLESILENQLDVTLYQLYDAVNDEVRDRELQDFTDSIRERDEIAQALVQAVQADFAQGHLGQKYLSPTHDDFLENQYIALIGFNWIDPEIRNMDGYTRNPNGGFQWTGEGPAPDKMESGEMSTVIALSPQAAHTIAVLEDYDIIGEDHSLISPLGHALLAKKWYDAGETKKIAGGLLFSQDYNPTVEDFFNILW